MMNYDGLLSQLADDKLSLFQGHGSVAGASIQDGAVEEEQIATIHNVPYFRPAPPPTSPPQQVTPVVAAAPAASAKPSNAAVSLIETTPQRKISTSSRLMNAFQQLYTGSASSGQTDIDENEVSSYTLTSSAANRTPTKGMESKLLSMWHNVKYGWSGKLKSNFSKEQPVWLLGRCYHRKFTPPYSMENSTDLNAMLLHDDDATTDCNNRSLAVAASETTQQMPTSGPPPSTVVKSLYPVLNPGDVDEIVVPQELGMDAAENQVGENPWEEGIDGFRRDFYSRIWMTYRREFPTMNGSNYTSDCGWGCMLRSGQMLMAQGLICHFLGRSWRYDPETQLHSTYEDNMHKKIIKWFGDSSSKTSPFSIHALVSLGEAMGKKPGDWYGPASVSYLLKKALSNAAQENADFDNITIYVAKDCTIYMQDVEETCAIPEPSPKQTVPWQTGRKPQEATPKVERKQWKSLMVLIPLRLGTEKLNPVYAHCLKLLLSSEYCIGIIGGRPKHSLYFVGYQEDKLIHLDPHYCQEMVDVSQENFSLNSFHCKSPRKLKTSKMDPSCCIGFYCQNKADFDLFVESVQPYLHPMRCASGTIDKVIPPSQQMPTVSSTTTSSAYNTTSADGLTSSQYNEMNYPLFTFSRGRCLDHEVNEMSDSLYKPLQCEVADLKRNLLGTPTHYMAGDDDSETEEFVLL